VSSNVIEVLVSGLRKKIHAQGEPPILRTRRGFGYLVE
jgi:DNA-binding response OmpR family regulator